MGPSEGAATMRRSASMKSTSPLHIDVCTPYRMTGYALRLSPMGSLGPEIDEVLGSLLRLLRVQDVEFLVDYPTWCTLIGQRIEIANGKVLAAGGSTLCQSKELVAVDSTGARTPILRFTTTMASVEQSLKKARPLPQSALEQLRKIHGGELPAPVKMQLDGRPADCWYMQLTARWIETDNFEHVNQSQYGVWMEEARASACAAGAYSPEGQKLAHLPVRRVVIQYEGQALGGDEVRVYTWWTGEAFAFEVEKENPQPREKPITTRGRIWVQEETPKLSAKESKSLLSKL